MKTLLKIIGWIVGIVVVLIILSIVAFKLFFEDDAKRMAIERGSAALERPLSIESVSLSFWGGLGVTLGGVQVGNPEQFGPGQLLTADNVDVKLKFLPLLSGEYRLSRLIIDSPHITMHKRPDGTNNFTFALADSAAAAEGVATPEQLEAIPDEARAATMAVSFDRLQIRDGYLEYRDDSTGVSAVLEGFDLSTSLENPREGVFRSSGSAGMDRLSVTLDKPQPTFALGLTYDLEYDQIEDRLIINRADVKINDLGLEVAGEAKNLLGETSGRLDIKTEEIAIRDVLSLLPAEQVAMLEDYTVDGRFSLDADLDYDPARGEETALMYTGSAVVSNLTMSKKDIEGELKLRRALLDFKVDNLRMTIEDGTFDGKPLKGYLTVDNFADPTVNGQLAGELNLVFAQPFMPAEGKHELSGAAGFDVKFAGRIADAQNMNFSGDIRVNDGYYASEMLPEPLSDITLDVYCDNRLVNVRRFTGRLPSGDVSFTGRFTDLIPYLMADSAAASAISPGFDGDLKGNLDLALANRYLSDTARSEVKGRLALDLAVRGELGKLADIKPRGSIEITNGSYRDTLLPEPIKSFTARMTIVPDTVKVDNLTIQFTSSDVSFSGKLVRPLPYLLPFDDIDRTNLRKPMFLFDLTSRRFDTDKMFPEAVPGSGESLPSGAEVNLDSVPLVILPDIDGQGTLKADTIIYSKVEFTNIRGLAKIQNRKLTITEATADVYTGKAKGEVVIDLNDFNNPRYTGRFEARQIEADDFLTRFSKFGGYLFGKVDVSGNYDAVGWEPEQMLNSLTVDGDGGMHDGTLRTSGALQSLISNIAEKTGQTFKREQSLKNLASKIAVKEGKVYLDTLDTRLGDIGDVSIGGFYGLMTEEIGYAGTILLSEETTKKLTSKGGLIGGLAGLLSNGETKRLSLPLKIGGTMNSPKVEVDWTTLQKAAGDKVQDKLKDDAKGLIEGLFPKKK